LLVDILEVYLGITAKRRDLRTTHPVTESLSEEQERKEKSSIQNV
jgi:hypothetical protein